MSCEQPNTIKVKRLVGGIVRISPELGKDFPYAFWELDTLDRKQYDYVLEQYARFNLDVVVHRVGKGYHFFGGSLDMQVWREWYATLKHLNPDFPTLTLRITRKFGDETWERPVYIEAQSVIPNWSKALMSFLNKEQRFANQLNIHNAMKACGLPKYFKCVVYDVHREVVLNGV